MMISLCRTSFPKNYSLCIPSWQMEHDILIDSERLTHDDANPTSRYRICLAVVFHFLSLLRYTGFNFFLLSRIVYLLGEIKSDSLILNNVITAFSGSSVGLPFCYLHALRLYRGC